VKSAGGAVALDSRTPTLYAKRSVEVQLTPDQQAFVRQAIESGRLQREEDAVKEARAEPAHFPCGSSASGGDWKSW